MTLELPLDNIYHALPDAWAGVFPNNKQNKLQSTTA
jgi:hypothetical protein